MVSTEVGKVRVALDQSIDRVITRLMLDVHANVVEDSPVDLGWFRALWHPGVGKPVNTAIKPPIDRDARKAQISGLKSQQQTGVASLLTFKARDGDEAFITNNAPYAIPLNDGHSGQAASGFVQRAITRAIATANARGGD